MTLILSGTDGLSDVDGSAATPAIRGTDANTGIFFPAADTIAFSEGGTEVARFDSSGNLGIGTSSPTVKLDVVTASGASYVRTYNGTIDFYSGVQTTVGGALVGTVSNHPVTFFTNNAERMRIDSSGNLLVGVSTNSETSRARIQNPDSTEWSSPTLLINNSSAVKTFAIYNGAVGYSSSATVGIIAKNTTTSRSLNAAGTLNASGADYAEYMTKAGNFNIAKGDVVGINVQGKLTNVFADAVSFCVKSTDPSYVGGDVWGNEEALGLVQPKQPAQRQATEEVEAETDEEFAIRQSQYESDKAIFEAALEAARQTVDRIAFAGQVPVNVLGATAGQYIIPVNDNGAIKGEAVSNPTFEQYQTAVGKVIAVESDGRARIIVKVA